MRIVILAPRPFQNRIKNNAIIFFKPFSTSAYLGYNTVGAVCRTASIDKLLQDNKATTDGGDVMGDSNSKDRSALMDDEYEWIAVSYLSLMVKKAIRDSGYSEKWNAKVDGEHLVDERYGEYPQQVMDVFVPKNLDPSKLRGAFLFLHGGA